MPETMRAAVVPEAGGQFELGRREIPEPEPSEVRIAVDACGVCHSDVFVKEGTYPGVSYPRVPGHEVAGRIDTIGADVTSWTVDDRVGAGWHGGHCFTCEPCRRGAFKHCENGDITGLTYDGGYAEYVTVPTEAVAAIPDALHAVEAAPLLCAGVTTFNALRNADARPGDLVAVQGVGGLGHLGLQYAHAAGFETVAISGSPDKETLAMDLGADHFVDATATDPAGRLQELGGASVVLATAPSSDAIASVVGGLDADGTLLVAGVPEEDVPVDAAALIGTNGAVAGWASGQARDSQDTLEFSALRGIAPTVETYPLSEVETAYDRMLDNEARFRAVLEP
jgi:NADPH2:quinone reductase